MGLPRAYGAYTLLKSLGQGAMGDIHLARPNNPDRGIPTPIVIKRLHGELATNADFVRRFKHEAEVAISVDTLHVAKVYDVGSIGESLYIAMEYVAGWPVSKFLDAVIASGRHASVASVIDLLAGGLKGLHALHTAVDIKTNKPLGIVHRDISPKNLMVGEDGKMRLIDLGLGKSNVQDWKTRTGVVMGSVGYMPPEQVAGEHVDHRADIYAMGVVLFEALALRNYIPRGPIPKMLKASLTPEFQAVSKYRPDVPKGLDEVIRRAVAPKADERWHTAQELLDAIRSVVPERRTEGGMKTLIDELFGASIPERHQELVHLLSLPFPEEGPEEDQTQAVTFVQREGVKREEDVPTRVGVPDQASMVPTAMRPGSVYPSGAQALDPASAMRFGSQVGATGESPIMPFMSGTMMPPPRQGVSLGVLAFSMVLTLAVGVAIGAAFLRGGDQATPLTGEGALPPPPAPVVKPQVPEAYAQPAAAPAVPEVPAAAPPPPPSPETVKAPPKPKPPPARPKEEGAVAATETAPPPPPPRTGSEPSAVTSVGSSREGLTSAVSNLMKRAQTLKASQPAGSAKISEIDRIRAKASMEAGATDFEQATRRVKALEAELKTLESAP